MNVVGTKKEKSGGMHESLAAGGSRKVKDMETRFERPFSVLSVVDCLPQEESKQFLLSSSCPINNSPPYAFSYLLLFFNFSQDFLGNGLFVFIY